MDKATNYFLLYKHLQKLLDVLTQSGFTCIGPQIRDNTAIVYDQINYAEQLPWGIRDQQTPGQYKLEKIAEKKAFAFANGAQAIKPLLFKPIETVWKVVRNDANKLEFIPTEANESAMAIIGARACDLAAMEIQDKVFLHGTHIDLKYKKRREQLFIVAVNCSYASQNCFCVSAGTGPTVKKNFDILMSEVTDGFVVQFGSTAGANILKKLPLYAAKLNQCQEAAVNIQQAADMQTKRIPLDNSYKLRDLLFSNLDHPRWDEVAERCLSCGNCTQVCPTCFCHTTTEDTKLDGSVSEHQREWDSCFTAGHSYLYGKALRNDTRKRYRQWLTHKVGSWHDQFDVSGCVGCGRCISWCPVGIDLTEELAAISGQSNVMEAKSSEE